MRSQEKIIVENNQVLLCRNGSIKNMFNRNILQEGTFSHSILNITEYPTKGYLVYGLFKDYKYKGLDRLILINYSGYLNREFSYNASKNSAFNGLVSGCKILSNGKIAVYGHFTNYKNHKGLSHFIILNPDGTLDECLSLKIAKDSFDCSISHVDEKDGIIEIRCNVYQYKGLPVLNNTLQFSLNGDFILS